MNDNRREFLKKSTTLAALSVVGLNACSKTGNQETENSTAVRTAGVNSKTKIAEWPIKIGENMPRLTVGVSNDASVAEMRQLKQIGVDYVLMGGPPIPWTEESLRKIINRFKAEGLTVINMMIGGHPHTIYGRKGRDEEIKQIQDSLRAAGTVGLPVVEYNFYAHRLMEGYYREDTRGGAGNTSFDYEKGRNLPTDPKLGTPQTAEMLWANLTYFLKAVIPVAEKAGVRMALHPNDPPIPVSHGHAQIMATFKDWQRLIQIVDSPANGMTYDCGVTRETGEDPLEVLRYLGSRDRINHIHYRNVTVEKPYVKYSEVFFDEGQVNMFAVMQEIFGLNYKFGIYPEHPREISYDKEHAGGIKNQYPGGGGYAAQAYNVAYTKAMMQAVVSLKDAAVSA
ncbi:mannonate dehydratase [Adhaeribacter pallidiroseus]|uniref:mannonate dehydratase n=1 Tax=Adhaeribacter pallidiroseus TaxID=2072847 RepID=A0A369QM81_9BACT|nr:mannonate dehydratase [Adhaeribacter pallidiroseus]RDC64347.1 Mannonate dehydratase [Adhaeribacter pallidiroseus]